MGPATRHRVLAIATDAIEGAESIEEIRRAADGAEVRLIVPAVEATPFRHTLGDVDGPKRQAEERLRVSLAALGHGGVEAVGEVGDPDPVQAAADALREGPADEILIFEHAGGQARWYEDGLFEKAQEALEPPLRMIVVRAEDGAAEDHVIGVERAGAGTKPAPGDEIESAYLPGFSRQDFIGMAVGIVGTIVVAVLAAAVSSGSEEVGWKAVAIGVAIFTALINMAHVVGLTLFESVRYRGGFAKLFRTLSMVGTPLAVLVNLLILVLS